MALIDARIKRTARLSETKDSKGIVQLSASQDFLVISDTANPSFASVLADTTSWSKLGGPLPQVGDDATIGGKSMVCSSRDVSYAGKSDRVVLVSVRYSAREDPAEQSPPSGTDPETWQRITVTSQQMSKPAVGWPSRGAVPPENNNDEGDGAQNSAGDPVDGLEEDCALVKLTYTNTAVPNPSFEELQRYTNRCNNAVFLGGDDYTVRMVGWNAEYDQKNNVWAVSVEFLYNPDGWQIRYFDAGYNEIIDGERRAILDKAGNPVSKPVPLDGSGQAQTINGSPTGDEKPTDPVTLELYPYKIADMSALFANCGI